MAIYQAQPIQGYYFHTKLFVEHATGLEPETLHVLVGVLAWLVLALVSRRPVSSWLPWWGLLTLAVGNEMIDLWVERWPCPLMQYGEGAKDLALTMVLPTIIFLALRYHPSLFASSKDHLAN